MGLMIDGQYHEDDPAPDSSKDGVYRRRSATIRNWITQDGTAGKTGQAGFIAEHGRYHLFVARNCPWAHRALLARVFHNLEDKISISVALPRRNVHGWVFSTDGTYSDPLFNASALHEIYSLDRPAYTGRITVPLLWDKQSNHAVSNESADIIRMLNDAFNSELDLYPKALRPEIDRWNALIYPNLNNGVYRAGFARTQAAYDDAVAKV